ncbi:hypothetical protein DL767_007818 [Monosporascus sp. MG133]|nr:hypothetical protein DL767_007818 [Monosporascus sp. MG133]
MNGYAHRSQDSFDAGMPQALRPSPVPNEPAMRDPFSRSSSNSFGQENARLASMNPGRPQSSFLDLKDPVQVHLLTETALLDSKEFQILSQEEVDALKKRCQALNLRIEQTRSSLAIQSKYRDAAVSMSKLYSAGRPDGVRRSLLGNRTRADSDAAREAEAEREAIQKKCDDLASELRSLEKRAMEPQRKLLEHTAGILQLAYKKSKKPSTPVPKTPLVNGVPASPESMFSTSNGRNSLEHPGDFFVWDQGSLYQSFDQLDPYGVAAPRTTPLEIPLKSPSREASKQLTAENDKLRQENDQLRDQLESLSTELDSLRGERSNHYKLITDTETKLERLNNLLREQIVSADPARNNNYKAPPSGQLEPGDMIGSHLDYLENGLHAVKESFRGGPDVTERLHALNLQVQNVLLGVNSSHPSAPDSAADADQQVAYMQESLQAVEYELQRAADISNSSSAEKQKTEQSETVLIGLWEIIQSGYADIRKQKQDRRKARMEKGLEVDEEDMSEGEFDLDEQYSLPAFSTKVQWLYAQATSLREQKAVLKRQIKQQRELNSRSDSEKDQAMRDKIEELEQTQQMLEKAEREADLVRSELSQAIEDMNNMQKSRSEEAALIDEAQAALRERNQKIAAFEASSRDVQSQLAVAEANIEAITAQLQQANDDKEAAEKAAQDKQAEIDAKQKEIEDKQKELDAKNEELAEMTGMVTELKIEATLAKAELDGAYGTRKERAAEAAALHDSSETAKMLNRINALEKELKATAKDLTDVVQQSVEAEKKIGQLESELDRATAERARLRDQSERAGEELEARAREAAADVEERLGREIARLRRDKEQLQDELDSERLKSGQAPPLSPGGAMRTSYLTESYRSGLRSERRKHEEQLRAEQMARRKVEEELKALKRAQVAGKSTSLNPPPR